MDRVPSFSFQALLRVAMIAFAGALSLSHFGAELKPFGQYDGASSARYERRYVVSFQPIAGAEPITFRDEKGNVIGSVGEEAVVDVTVNESTLRTATTPQGIHMGKLVAALSVTQTPQGKFMRVAAPFEMRTKEGKVIPRGSSVLLDLRRYGGYGIIQPSGSWGVGANGASTSDAVTNRFNDILRDRGVTGTTRNPNPQTTPQGRAPLLDSGHGSGNSYGQRVFSSPTCDCRRGYCQTTSYFGPRNSFKNSNGTRASSYHKGLDIGGGAGTPIVASADGCVSRVYTNRTTSYGLSVFLDHGNGLQTQYSHLKNFRPGLRPGQCFKRGEVIGAMGSTGNATGPHLHFGVLKDGVEVDPFRYLIARSNKDFSPSCSTPPQVPSMLASESGGNSGGSSGSMNSSTGRVGVR